MSAKSKANKQMSLKEAIQTFVRDGTSITFGGFIGRDCIGAAHEIIRQGIKDLVVIDDSKTDMMDLLVGAGCVRRWEGAYLILGGLEARKQLSGFNEYLELTLKYARV